MKNHFILFLACIATLSVEAKKVKFAVDMTDQTINANGIHVSGDFQTLAGFPGDNWNSATTTLTKEGTTNIYSIVVTLPAFQKYEYKFVNGDQFYEAEFVPEISRVGHDFNDNRWIYLDSLSTDTFFLGAIRFGENAPAGLKMVRFLTDLIHAGTVNSVHVAATLNGMDHQKNILYSFIGKLYEVIQFVPAGTQEYIFANGTTAASAEIVPAFCSNTNGRRTVNVQSDTVLATTCFSQCDGCEAAVSYLVKADLGNLFPNPSTNGSATIQLNSSLNDISVFDAKGSKIRSEVNYTSTSYSVNHLKTGLFFVRISTGGQSHTMKLIVQ